MRCFLGLDLSPQSKLAIEQWRQKALPPFPHPVPAANFHVTSVFLGNIENGQLDDISREIDKCEFDPVSIAFDTLGFWAKPKILWLGAEHIPPEAKILAESLTSIAKLAGVQVQERKYIPHVTLVRKIHQDAPAPLFPPQFTCHFDKLHLFESVSGKKGVHYPSRLHWPLMRLRSPGNRG